LWIGIEHITISKMSSSPLKIFHIMTAESHGGAETYAADAILGLTAHKNVQQTAFISKNALCHADLNAAGVKIYDRWSGFRFKPWMRWHLKKAIRAEQPDIIHCWMRRAAELVPAELKIPVIGWLGGYYTIAKFKHCSDFIGVTFDIARHIKESGIAADHAYTVHTFSSVETDHAAVDRAALKTLADAPVLLALSRLHAKKGLDTLLHALVTLPDCYAWLAGDGPLENELKTLAATLGVSDRVRFLGWRTDRGALLNAANICVLPSRYEPFGTVMVEAWAAGVPLIAAAVAGPAAYITHEENGLLVAPDDAEALSAAIRRVLEDGALRDTLITKGQETYVQRFTREGSTNELLSVYQRVLRGA
jgi:glycosyltransferase involved in cell wall biosynthesis